MARYFHTFCGSDVHMDENGQDFSDLKGAKARASEIAKELAEDSYCEGSVRIFDEKGNQWTVCRSAPTSPEATKSRFRSTLRPWPMVAHHMNTVGVGTESSQASRSGRAA